MWRGFVVSWPHKNLLFHPLPQCLPTKSIVMACIPTQCICWLVHNVDLAYCNLFVYNPELCERVFVPSVNWVDFTITSRISFNSCCYYYYCDFFFYPLYKLLIPYIACNHSSSVDKMLAGIQYRWQWQYWLWFLLDSVMGFYLKYCEEYFIRFVYFVTCSMGISIASEISRSIQINSIRSCNILNKCLWFLFIRFLIVVAVVCGKK